MNTNKDFQEIQYAYDGRKDGKQFRIKNVDYYKMVDERQLIDITNKKYDFVLIDLGSFEDMYDMDTFLRADIKVVMCHGADWKTRHLRKFYDDLGFRDKFKEWKIYVPYMSEKWLKEIKDEYHSEVYGIPFQLNPFKLEDEVESDLSKILEKSTRMKLFNEKKNMFSNTAFKFLKR